MISYGGSILPALTGAGWSKLLTRRGAKPGGDHERGAIPGAMQEAAGSRPMVDYGQVEPPLLSAAVLSPLPQIMNVPIAVLVYL
jgi:hypothetical protein